MLRIFYRWTYGTLTFSRYGGMSIMLRGKKIYLRPLAQADLPIFAAWSNDLEYLSEFNTFGLHWPGELAKGWQEGGLLDSRHGTLAIVTYDEQITGNVSYHQQHYGPNDGVLCITLGSSWRPNIAARAMAQKLSVCRRTICLPPIRSCASKPPRISPISLSGPGQPRGIAPTHPILP